MQEYFAIVEYLIVKMKTDNDKIILNSNIFYPFLDKNLYIKRNEKLKVYKKLNMIICNSNSFTSVMYDKETKKSQRKIIVDLNSYKLLKALYSTTVN